MDNLQERGTGKTKVKRSEGQSRDKVWKINEEYKEERKRKQEEDEEASQQVTMSEEEICDLIKRTSNATKYLLSLLPALDEADKKRMLRASKPTPKPRDKNDQWW